MPFDTPWRTLQIADQATGLVESNLILNLNEPNALGDVSWVKPSKYVGVWWSMHLNQQTWATGPTHAATTATTKRYIDFAAAHAFAVCWWKAGIPAGTASGLAMAAASISPEQRQISTCQR
nr:glycoside hydrolase family 97 catalytic domain-containing protein [Xanthomonas campestris pv. campestris]